MESKKQAVGRREHTAQGLKVNTPPPPRCCFTCQPAQTAVPQPRVLLHLLQLLHVQAELPQTGQ